MQYPRLYERILSNTNWKNVSSTKEGACCTCDQGGSQPVIRSCCANFESLSLSTFLDIDRFHGYNDRNINITLLNSQPCYGTGFVCNLYQFPNDYAN